MKVQAVVLGDRHGKGIDMRLEDLHTWDAAPDFHREDSNVEGSPRELDRWEGSNPAVNTMHVGPSLGDTDHPRR